MDGTSETTYLRQCIEQAKRTGCRPMAKKAEEELAAWNRRTPDSELREALEGPGPRTEEIKERAREIRREQGASPSNLAYLSARYEWRLNRLRQLLDSRELALYPLRRRLNPMSEPVKVYMPSHWRETIREHPNALIGFYYELSEHDAKVEEWEEVFVYPADGLEQDRPDSRGNSYPEADSGRPAGRSGERRDTAGPAPTDPPTQNPETPDDTA